MRSIALRLTGAFLILTVLISVLSTALSRFSAPAAADKGAASEPWWATAPSGEDSGVDGHDHGHAGHHAHGGHFDLDDDLPAGQVPVSLDELAAHTDTSAWVAIDGVVYDVTDYAEFHPGGPEIIREHAGTDVSRTFNAIHAPGTILLLAPEYRVGVLE